VKHANRITGPMVLVVLISASAAYGATVHEHVIYPLPGAPGCFGPSAPLISDANGNLYGSTFDGGAYFKGCIFELSPNSDGTWSEKNLHTFSGLDGGGPVAALVFDAADNLYGTTEGGGAYDGGVVFELSPSEDGQWARDRSV
jgi:uncharacterized repeat protein (TIGR03803 family)